MYVSMHCAGQDTSISTRWVRRHDDDEPLGSQDYITLTVETKQGQTVLFLTAAQANRMAFDLDTACHDRAVVLNEEAGTPAAL